MDSQPADSYYNLLVQGFRAGQLNVKREAPPGLAQLADPFDYEAAKPYLPTSGSTIHRHELLQGQVVFLFWDHARLVALLALCGADRPLSAAQRGSGDFLFGGFSGGRVVLWALWRRYFAEVGFGVVVAGALALGLATGIPVLLPRV